MNTMTNLRRTRWLAGLLAGACAVQTACGGQGDPPVIVLPSAKAAQKNGIVQTQAMQPVVPGVPAAPKVELLPPPSAEPPSAKPVAAPPLLVAPMLSLPEMKPPVETKPVEKPVPVEVAPTIPKLDPANLPANEVVPAPQVPMLTPGLPPPIDITPLKSAVPAPVLPNDWSPLKANPVPTPDAEKKAAPVIEKITDYAKATDVKAILEEIAGIKKDMAGVNALAKAADVKALKDDIATLQKNVDTLAGRETKLDTAGLKKDIAAMMPKPVDVDALKKDIATMMPKPVDVDALKKDITAMMPKPVDVDALKKDIATMQSKPIDVDGLKKDLAAMMPKPFDGEGFKKEIVALLAKQNEAKPWKDEVDTLRKDVQGLSTLVRESIDTKAKAAATGSDAVVTQLKKMDGTIDTLSRKVLALETKLAETRTAASLTQPNPMPATPAASAEPTSRGTVRIVNEYPVGVAITINGVEHRVNSGASLDVPTAAGTFKYQLTSIGGDATERSLKENEVVTLTIR